MDMDDPKKVIGCCCCVTAVIAIAGLVFFSFSSLDAQEYGLDYSSISKTIDDKVYTSGYHFLGFAHSFIVYPSVVLNMEFSNDVAADREPIESRTEDGVPLSFKASFQYLLDANRLYDLYMRYGENYRPPCERFAVDILNDAATKHDANSFFTSQDEITTKMQQALNATLANECFAILQDFQLSGIDLPNKFEDAISDTQVQDQDILTAQAEKKTVSIELTTKISKARISQGIIVNNAKASAQSQLQNNEAQNEAFVSVQSTQTDAYAALKEQLGMTNEELLGYIKATAVGIFDQDNRVISLEGRT